MCHKNHTTIRVIALWRVHETALTTAESPVRFEIISILKEINLVLKEYMINRLLHSWSFNIKFKKRAFCELHKFDMK